MKKTTLLLTAAMGVFALTACGPKNSAPKSWDPSVCDTLGGEEPAAWDTTKAANGGKSYVYSPAADRTEILGKLEKWAVDNKLTGLTLYEDGAYVMYNENIKKGTNSYIPGYGFGILGEGSITADLESEQNAKWKRYYHSLSADDPASLNYMNDKGSEVADFLSYTAGSYWDTVMNETKDGYQWIPSLAKESRPVPQDLNSATGMASTYKFHVKTGSEFKYATNSTKYAAFNNREVELEDYVTPYKIYYTNSYGLARTSENLTGSGSILGAANVVKQTTSTEMTDEIWAGIGIKSGTDAEGGYLQFTFNQPCTPFYAMYYLASSMFAPVPAEFISTLGNGSFKDGVAKWGNFSVDMSESPLDTYLSTGPYKLETWENKSQVVYERNPNFQLAGRYSIAGVKISIFPAVKNDPNAAFEEFLAGKTSSCSIPMDYLDQYKNDPRTTQTVGSTTTKLNLNTCTQEQWEELFGEEGTIAATPEDDYWECEPAMSNKNFVSGLSFALDRKTLAESLGRTPSANYFGSAYMIDPENGIAYNSTDAHKNAMKDMLDGTDGFGYSLEKAKASFKKACDELICSGVYKPGDTIKLEMAWQEPSDFDIFGNPIKEMLEEAFDNCGGFLKLEIKNWAGAVWSDVYYSKMMVGQFDIGFGGVNGNTYDPLNFLEVLKSDNSSGFTLNWGVDTNAVDGTLFYDGQYWSFDALWSAADSGTFAIDGMASPLAEFAQATLGDEVEGGIMTVALPYFAAAEVDASFELTKIVANGYVGAGIDEYFESAEVITWNTMEYEGVDYLLVFIPQTVLDEFAGMYNDEDNYGYFMIDFFGCSTICGTTGAETYMGTTYILNPAIYGE
ncbi:MAG: ABC transporter substrate-binding protein [Bacilli bacterium]|nr:ABC transporter substrate-binding protein [Bacilli bacterium]